METLQIWLNNSNTHPQLTPIIINRLTQWHNTEAHPPIPNTTLQTIRTTVTGQDDIGWYQFFLGRTNIGLADIQEIHLQSLSLQKTGLRWTQALVNKLWLISWGICEHRNNIKHNTITPQLRTELEALQDAFHEQRVIGIQGMLKADHKLIKKLDKVYTLPINEQKLWLQSILNARMAAQAHTTLAAIALQQQRNNLARFLQFTH